MTGTEQSRALSQVVTFYSFKGGVGRSMALANVAAWLARWDLKILAVDWDLEAPGLSDYFRPWTSAQTLTQPVSASRPVASEPSAGPDSLLDGKGRSVGLGLVDLLIGLQNGDQYPSLGWQDVARRVALPGELTFDFIGSGTLDKEYFEKVHRINYQYLFDEAGFGAWIENTRAEWLEKYDFILIDSRTGVTDIGGVCTIHFPDVLVGVYTANEQSLLGLKGVLVRAMSGHQSLNADRKKLIILPLPSRDETENEYRLASRWRKRAAEEFDFAFADWLPEGEDRINVLEFLKIPYIPYWSFGERIPVVEERDPENPKTLAFAYQPLARLLANGLDWKKARYADGATGASARDFARAEEARAQLRLREELQEQRRSARDELQAYIERVREKARTASINLRIQSDNTVSRAVRYGGLTVALCILLISLPYLYEASELFQTSVHTFLKPEYAAAAIGAIARLTPVFIAVGVTVSVAATVIALVRSRTLRQSQASFRRILDSLDRLEAGTREISLMDDRTEIQHRYERHVDEISRLSEQLTMF